MDAKLTEWAQEFGEVTAKQLFEVVTREMENYDYVRQFKLQVGSNSKSNYDVPGQGGKP